MVSPLLDDVDGDGRAEPWSLNVERVKR